MAFRGRLASGKYSKFSNELAGCRLGHSHRSKLESSVCAIYQLRERSGDAELLGVEDHVYLTDARILYIPDFRLRNASGLFWGESKGFETPEWKIKKRLWEYYGPGPLEIWRGSAGNPRLTEVVIPKVKKT